MKPALSFSEAIPDPQAQDKEMTRNHAAGMSLYCHECQGCLGYLFMDDTTTKCSHCGTEQFVSKVAYLEAENKRLREGWRSVECTMLWTVAAENCDTCPYDTARGVYCEAVMRAVEE